MYGEYAKAVGKASSQLTQAEKKHGHAELYLKGRRKDCRNVMRQAWEL